MNKLVSNGEFSYLRKIFGNSVWAQILQGRSFMTKFVFYLYYVWKAINNFTFFALTPRWNCLYTAPGYGSVTNK